MKPALEVKVPCENVNDLTARIVAWKIASGASVKEGDVIVELENSKATFPLAAPMAGVVEHARLEGEEVPVGETLFRISADGTGNVSLQPNLGRMGGADVPVQVSGSNASGAATFSKKARELMTELGLTPDLFAGMSFVKESDVRQKALALGKSKPSPAAATPEKVLATTDNRSPVALEEEAQRVPLERSKLLENRELLAADRAALKSTIFYLCPAAGLQEACARHSPPLQRLVVILYEAARLLEKFRHLNASFTEDAALLYRHVHAGFAVDMGHGLKVLVIRNAEQLSFSELAERFEELLVKYATNTLTVPDVTGSTFTVTDLAQDGVFAFAPLLNSRQAAILAIGAETAGFPGFMLTCAFDHRLIGGKQVAEFMRELSARIVFHADSLRKSSPAGDAFFCARCLQTGRELRALRAFLIPSVEPAGYICSNCLSGY